MKQVTISDMLPLSEIVPSISHGLKSDGAISVLGLNPNKSKIVNFLENFGTVYTQYGGAIVWDVAPSVFGADTSIGNEEINLHTEMNEFEIAPDFVALFCIRNSNAGGLLKLTDSHKLLNTLSGLEIEKLRESTLRFKTKKSIGHTYGRIETESTVLSFNEESESCIRFSQNAEILRNKEEVLSFKEKLELQDTLLHRQMAINELIVWDNARILHGRTRFEDTERLLWRICLSKFRAA